MLAPASRRSPILFVPSPACRALLLGALLTLAALPARAEEGWLGWFNRHMYAFNAAVAETLSEAAEAMPALPAGVTEGARNLAVTYVGEPLNAAAHLLAGRGEDAWVAARRIGTNVTRGWLGTVDRAAEEGLRTNPIDFGLALCTLGVPPGPTVVVPLMGIRTLRDFLSDWTAAHAVLYGTVLGVFQMPVNLQTLVAIELVEEGATLAIGHEIGATPDAPRQLDLEAAEQHYLAARERRCAELSAP
jgi:ABC-type transporter lipoprotein component MlaA